MAASPRDNGQPSVVYRVIASLTRPIVNSVFRLCVSGLEHLPQGGFVLCSNHLSAFDPWALASPLYPRHPRFMAKSDLFTPWSAPTLDAIGLFPVERGRGDFAAIAAAAKHAADGRPVIIFPEGARRRRAAPGKHRPRGGAARVALQARVPLVPAAIVGTERPAALVQWRVAYGIPVSLDDLYSAPPAAAAREATRRLWRSIETLEASLRETKPALAGGVRVRRPVAYPRR